MKAGRDMEHSVFLAGYGTVGKAFVAQFRAVAPDLFRDRNLDLRLVGLTTTRACLTKASGFDAGSLEPAILEAALAAAAAATPCGTPALAEALHESCGPGSVFVDCTASPEVASLYPAFLETGVSVVAANKLANSGSYASWLALREAARNGGARFHYGANVGAGLPVISTLRDLVATGDEVLRIESVLSGTISFIFNNLSPARPFSSLVREAMARGYAEPDPRVDLSALDAARKALILAREAGLHAEPADVEIEPILPPGLPSPAVPASPADFLSGLAAADGPLEARRRAAEARGRVLRYVAAIEAGRASLGFREVEPGHPLAGLVGADNLVSFTTARYAEQPLVVRGPGAGAVVTAAGVLADLIRAAD